MIQYTTRELDAGIFQDDHLEKRIKAALKKENVKLLSVVFYMTQQGKYEVHLTVKAMKGRVVLAKDVAFLVGKCIGRTMIPRTGKRLVIGEEYGTIACMEGAKFQTLAGCCEDRKRTGGDIWRYISDEGSSGRPQRSCAF